LPYPTTRWDEKTVIVTGANVGIGQEAARHFVRLGARKVILGCRDLEKGSLAKEDIETSLAVSDVIEVWPLDLESFESVKDFARRADALARLDAVIESAGVMTTQFAEHGGWELQITVNVISTFLLAFLVLPALRRTAREFNTTPHIVVVSSDAHMYTGFRLRHAANVLEAFRGSDCMRERYGDSKLLQILVVRELAKELSHSNKPRVVLNTLSPGLCRSQLFRNAPWPINWFMPISLFLLGRTPEMGSRVLLAAASAGEETHGKYFQDCKLHAESRFVRSEEGLLVQKKVYDELMVVLSKIVPGIRSNI
jgi:retinol dehydrogenase 12